MKTKLNARKARDSLSTIISWIRVGYYRFMGATIGKDCMISFGAKLDCCSGKIIIGDRCVITHGCVILSHDASEKRIHRKNEVEETVRLGNDVFIGVNSIILKNVIIGDNSIIGAGSVVTKDVPPNVVVAGNPAKIIRKLTSDKSLI